MTWTESRRLTKWAIQTLLISVFWQKMCLFAFRDFLFHLQRESHHFFWSGQGMTNTSTWSNSVGQVHQLWVLLFIHSSVEQKNSCGGLEGWVPFHFLRFLLGSCTRASPIMAAHPPSASGVILSWCLGLSCYRFVLDPPQQAHSPQGCFTNLGCIKKDSQVFLKSMSSPCFASGVGNKWKALFVSYGTQAFCFFP